MGWEAKLSLIFFGILILLANVKADWEKTPQTYISDLDFEIIAQKDTFYCKPIINDKGQCLVDLVFIVKNTKPSTENLWLSTQFQYPDSIKLKEFKHKNGSKIIYSLGESEKLQVEGYTEEIFTQTLWVDMDTNQKFNITLRLTGNNYVVLDPIINTTINTTIPTLYMVNGSNIFESYDEFEYTTDAVSTLSDGDYGTYYYTSPVGIPIPYSNVIAGYSFNDIYDDTNHYLHDFTGQHDGYIIGELGLISGYGENGWYYGGNFDGVNDYVIVTHDNELNPSSKNFTMCAVFNTTHDDGSSEGMIYKRTGVNDGYYMEMLASEQVQCRFDGNSGNNAVTSANPLNNGAVHTVCCRRQGTNKTIWVDGVMKDSNTAGVGTISNTANLYIGSQDGGSNPFEGTIEQVALVNYGVPDSILKSYTSSLVNYTKGKSIQLYFNHSFETGKQYSLQINGFVDHKGVVRIMKYVNETEPNTTVKIDYPVYGYKQTIPLTSTGYFDTGYDYPLRIYSLVSDVDFQISDVYLVEFTNDTINPQLNSYSFNVSSLSCNESGRFDVNASDNIDVSSVIARFQYGGLGYESVSLTRISDDGFYEIRTSDEMYNQLNSFGYNFSQGYMVNISLLEINVTDSAGNLNQTTFLPNTVYLNYSCYIPETCVENWVEDTPSCRVNNTYISTYSDTNTCGTYDDLPAQNGTEQVCNYCSEDLVKNTGDCQYGDMQYVNYTDSNYSTCCAVTGLSSDCSVDALYPYNSTVSQSCQFFSDDMGYPLCPDIFRFNVEEKEYCLVTIPLNYSNETFKCLDYIENGNFENVQTNPEYRERTNGIFEFWRGDPESRTYFEPSNGLVNVYITKKNLHQGEPYYLHIVCRSDQRELESVHEFSYGYENLEFVFFSTGWLIDNKTYIIGGILLLVIIIVTLLFLKSWVTGK